MVFVDLSPSTEQNCLQYATQTGIDPARMVMDPNFATLFAHVSDGGDNGLPWDGVLDAQGMVYYWRWSEGGDPLSAIDELLQVEVPDFPGKQ